MKIEHVAFNVADSRATAAWLVEHLGLTIKRQTDGPPWGFFLADDGGSVMVELYSNPAALVPDYPSLPFLTLHLALVSGDVEADVSRLTAAGATLLGPIQHTESGDVVASLRDPWGLALQLVQRAEPMI